MMYQIRTIKTGGFDRDKDQEWTWKEALIGIKIKNERGDIWYMQRQQDIVGINQAKCNLGWFWPASEWATRPKLRMFVGGFTNDTTSLICDAPLAKVQSSGSRARSQGGISWGGGVHPALPPGYLTYVAMEAMAHLVRCFLMIYR